MVCGKHKNKKINKCVYCKMESLSKEKKFAENRLAMLEGIAKILEEQIKEKRENRI